MSEDKKELPKSLRYIVLDNDKLKDLLVKRGDILTEARELNKKREEVEAELKKMGHKMERLKDKSMPLVEAQSVHLEEFEMITEVKIEEDELRLYISNRVEEFKETYRKQIEDAKKAKEEPKKEKDAK